MTNYEHENKISDDEITSSLKVISTTRNCNECKIRNCKWGTCNCSQITANAALDLITRLQAQNKDLAEIIHNLTLEKDALFDKAEKLKAEVERLKRELDLVIENFISARYPHCVLCGNGAILTKSLEEYDELIANISAEAVKEFAEYLKEEWFNNYYDSPDVDFDEFVDNLLKEMLGEER